MNNYLYATVEIESTEFISAGSELDIGDETLLVVSVDSDTMITVTPYNEDRIIH